MSEALAVRAEIEKLAHLLDVDTDELQYLHTVPSDAQLILCAMNRSEIQSYKNVAHVIELDEKKILKESKYGNCRAFLNFDGSLPALHLNDGHEV